MSAEYIFLRKFTPEEILFDEEEVKVILLFFFPGYDSTVNDFVMNHSMREFAQGLFVEAVDASYAMGYVHIIFDIFYMKPNMNMSKALKKFGKKAVKHWFKHLKKITDLQDIKIYDSVRDQLRSNFISEFQLRLSGTIAKNKKDTAASFVDYAAVKYKTNKVIWG